MSKLVTNSGRIMDLSMPLCSAICIEDIAHHLGQISRFNGATDRVYTVAEHSVYCSHIVQGTRRTKFAALMHDATEAYVGDCISPLKSILPAFKKIEQDIWISICLKFDISFELSEAVHHADRIAYVTERMALIKSRPITDDPDAEVFADIRPHARPLSNIETDLVSPRLQFLARFNELYQPLPRSAVA